MYSTCYTPDNHETMVHLRADKIAAIATDIPPTTVITRVTHLAPGQLLVRGRTADNGTVTKVLAKNLSKDFVIISAGLESKYTKDGIITSFQDGTED